MTSTTNYTTWGIKNKKLQKATMADHTPITPTVARFRFRPENTIGIGRCDGCNKKGPTGKPCLDCCVSEGIFLGHIGDQFGRIAIGAIADDTWQQATDAVASVFTKDRFGQSAPTTGTVSLWPSRHYTSLPCWVRLTWVGLSLEAGLWGPSQTPEQLWGVPWVARLTYAYIYS
jgi:hypothetical protein